MMARYGPAAQRLSGIKIKFSRTTTRFHLARRPPSSRPDQGLSLTFLSRSNFSHLVPTNYDLLILSFSPQSPLCISSSFFLGRVPLVPFPARVARRGNQRKRTDDDHLMQVVRVCT